MSGLKIASIIANGDCAILVRFAQSKQLLAGIHSLCQAFIDQPLEHLINVIPAADNLTLVFNREIKPDWHVHDVIMDRCEHLSMTQLEIKTHEIPVCYHPDVASDLINVCDQLQIEVEQFIEWHTQPTYVIAMLGFLPGFAYLNGNLEQINMPRKDTPEIQVPAGSVAIAGKQTGLYALSSPGGWQVIGRTSMNFIDWQNRVQPMKLNPLDRVQFKAISLELFKDQWKQL
ncbi:MAG: 5-oxoprolinase subunit PxpB [Marinicella sp.]